MQGAGTADAGSGRGSGAAIDVIDVGDGYARTLLAQAYPEGAEHAPYLVTADYLFGEQTSLCILPLNSGFARLAVVTVPVDCQVPPHTPAGR